MALIGLTPTPKPADKTAAARAGGAGGDIVDVTDATFMQAVIEESKVRPVVIDLWAPWCGPCRQLTPTLEKAVTAAKGAVRLAKVNIDENPGIAQQFRVQSIPAVFVVDQGKAFQGFQGALPESQVKAFIDELAGPQGPSDIDGLLAFAAEALAAGDMGGAAQAYAQALQLEPDNVKAIAGLARCYVAGGDIERAKEVVAMAPAGAKDQDLAAVRAALSLAEQAQGETAPLTARLAHDADDHQARFELAGLLAGRGDFQGAADHLLTIIERDRTWNEEAARKQLLVVFEAAGPTSDVARGGRRRLSSLLFS